MGYWQGSLGLNSISVSPGQTLGGLLQLQVGQSHANAQACTGRFKCLNLLAQSNWEYAAGVKAACLQGESDWHTLRASFGQVADCHCLQRCCSCIHSSDTVEAALFAWQ